ncbi:hypothetical protein E8E12_003430 [Didymella heteroderae]|uniref:Uncharacterized protein n=1 Tax=Didymella heteroderae TaxID=1769908 RepID=A0A9P4WP73_9PLEO|nr:hypothetical protein E8E12_003430 [Didymella heteroderae]
MLVVALDPYGVLLRKPQRLSNSAMPEHDVDAEQALEKIGRPPAYFDHVLAASRAARHVPTQPDFRVAALAQLAFPQKLPPDPSNIDTAAKDGEEKEETKAKGDLRNDTLLT